MSRSHLSARHLLQQIESDRAKRAKRDIRPAWLIALVECAADLFEPLADVGRVGYDCQLDENGWSAALYLGTVELVGGKTDGETQRVDFRFDLKPLLDRFSRIDELAWSVLEQMEEQDEAAPRSFLSIDGLVEENRIRLTIHSSAPDALGPGLRRLSDGRFEPI